MENEHHAQIPTPVNFKPWAKFLSQSLLSFCKVLLSVQMGIKKVLGRFFRAIVKFTDGAERKM